MRVDVAWDGGKVLDRVRRDLERQVPFALARALTWTVGDARTEIQEDLPDTFTIRSKWTAGGIQTEPATKVRLIARVGSVSPYMGKHVEGGTREADGGKVAIPVRARRPRSRKTPPSKWPGSMFRRKRSRAFVAPSSKPGIDLVFDVRGREGSERLILMWILVPKARIPATWDLPDQAADVFARRWAPNMARSWRRVVKLHRQGRRR